MPSSLKRTLFGLFLVSGFCGLVYQIIWVRLALASFGVITPFVSVVVSVYMLGLALGTWLGGRLAGPLARRWRQPCILFYAVAEAVIGVSAIAVPYSFDLGRELLLPIGAMGSSQYLLLSSVLILFAMLPWCVCMGATFPLVMAFVKQVDERETTSFSYLYLANVLGALAGTLATSVVLIELFGFRTSLIIAGALNILIALVSLALARSWRGRVNIEAAGARPETVERKTGASAESPVFVLLVLFTTGLTSMAMEMAWLRAFTPIMGTVVYAFAGLLTTYLLATWIGSFIYRLNASRFGARAVSWHIALAAIFALLPVLVVDPGVLPGVVSAIGGAIPGPDALDQVIVALLSIMPFCAVLGSLTPMLIDQHAAGNASKAGVAYAVNIVGSIAGPILAAYVLLPWLGARSVLILLTLPFALTFAWQSRAKAFALRWQWTAILGAIVFSSFYHASKASRSYEEGGAIESPVVRRDHTATVISFGARFNRMLLVNGNGMTVLGTLTKVMAHFPLACLEEPPKNSLVICFGMGTTYRSLLTWDIDATAVELVPSVADAFDYYHSDADAVRANARGSLVIDDGRRFLARTEEVFDVITVDPPPPLQTAGSSMLYSREFYDLAKARLSPTGIVAVWVPDPSLGESEVGQAVIRTCAEAFEYVRVFRAITGTGLHIFGSNRPIDVADGATLIARMPEAARDDLMEWEPRRRKLAELVDTALLKAELPLGELLVPEGVIITDDVPFNEYFLLRYLGWK